MFIFFCGKENEPKETALAPGPFGLPCASRSRRALWNSLTLKQPQGLFRRLLRCSARDDGTQNACRNKQMKYVCGLRKTPYLRGLAVGFYESRVPAPKSRGVMGICELPQLLRNVAKRGIWIFSELSCSDNAVSKNQTVSQKVQVQGAQISRSEAYYCTPQRLRDAAQRRNWAFCETVMSSLIFT